MMNSMKISSLVLATLLCSCSSLERSPEATAQANAPTPSEPIQATTAAATPAPPPAHHEEVKGVDPDQAQKWLVNGNNRFAKHHLRNDGQSLKDVVRLSKGQAPHSIVLSCSDSRVPPELVFDQKLGEVFVIRTAGESLDSNAIGSIEYAVEHLGARNIVVMGHTQCGAVKAALATMNGGDAGSPHLNKLVADLHPRLKNFERAPASMNYARESWANVAGVAQDLLTRSSLIAHAVQSGKVKIREGLYHLEDGHVDFNPQ